MISQRILTLMKDEKKKNFFIYGFGQVFNLLSPLIVAPYIVYICKESGFGKVGLGFALSLFLILIVDYAFDIKGTKQVAENRDNPEVLQHILSATIFTKIVLFFIAFLIALIFIFFIPFFGQEHTLFLLSIMIVFAQVFTPVWFLQGIENFKLLSLLNIGSKVLYMVLVFCLVKTEGDYIYVNLFLGLSSLFFNILGLVIMKRKYKYHIILPKTQEIIDTLRYDFTFCMSQLFLSVRQLSPLVLTGYFLGYFYAGQYKIIEQIITLFRTFLLVYLKFFYPSLCYKILSKIKEGFGYWKKYTSFSFIMIFLALSVLFVFTPEVLIFFNTSPHVINGLIPTFRLALLIPLLMAFNLPLEQLMFVLDKNKIYIRIVILVTIINIVLISLSIREFKLNGIVYSLIVSETLFTLLYFRNTFWPLKQK